MSAQQTYIEITGNLIVHHPVKPAADFWRELAKLKPLESPRREAEVDCEFGPDCPLCHPHVCDDYCNFCEGS